MGAWRGSLQLRLYHHITRSTGQATQNSSPMTGLCHRKSSARWYKVARGTTSSHLIPGSVSISPDPDRVSSSTEGELQGSSWAGGWWFKIDKDKPAHCHTRHWTLTGCSHRVPKQVHSVLRDKDPKGPKRNQHGDQKTAQTAPICLRVSLAESTYQIGGIQGPV